MTKVQYRKLSTLLTFSPDYLSSTLNYLDKQGYCPMQKLDLPQQKNDYVSPILYTLLIFLVVKNANFYLQITFVFPK